jgi:putative DNA primase/helicase
MTTTPPRPAKPPAPDVNALPQELKDRPQWVVWRYILRDGKWTKKPFQARYPQRGAKADDPSTWGTFDEAWAAYQSQPTIDGIGFEFSRDDPYFGCDIDSCLDAGERLDWAAPFLDVLESAYGDISPSGRGVKFIGVGKLPAPTGTRRNGMGPDGTGALELYDHGRFFTLTGVVFGTQTGDRVSNNLQDVADALYGVAKGNEPSEPESPGRKTASELHDDELIAKIRESQQGALFADLYDRGDTSRYNGDDSSADLALANILAFWFRKDAARMEAVFDRSKLGQREKWRNRPDYRKRTSEEAIAGCREVYAPTGEGEPSNLDRELAKRPCTDLGNGERFAARFGAEIRFMHPWKRWVHWDGRCWKTDDTAVARQFAKRTVRGIWREASTAQNDADRKALAKWWFDSESQARVEAMLSRASSEKGIPILPADMDRDGFLLNVQNGTIDLRTGKLREHRREDLITRIAPVDYFPDAQCPTWLRVLDDIFAKDKKFISFWQQLCGICLTADVSNQILPVLYGTGANGKTTILSVLLELLGPDYAITSPPGLLTVAKGERHPTELASLFGKRLVVDSETAEGARFNENLVKQLTGGDKITARRMREDFWEFSPTHKILLATNHKPEIRETKNAIWRRVKLVPFNVTIADDKQDAMLPAKLRAEYPGILAWCVEGCLDWQDLGLCIPAAVEDATKEYRAEQDLIGQFLEAECSLISTLETAASSLYFRYQKYAGGEAMNQRRFGNALTERGLERFKRNGTWYRGIGLKANEADSEGRGSYD